MTINGTAIKTTPILNGTKIWSNLPFRLKSVPFDLNGTQLLQLPHEPQFESNITINNKHDSQIFIAAYKHDVSNEFMEKLEKQNWTEFTDILHVYGPNEESYNYTLWKKDLISGNGQTFTLSSNETTIAIFIGQGK